ncbi:lytic murein transglycosylase [Thiomicrorhabdus aquaedulcis]|uniref:lytic murein transglycosylase n=1 Tax=Thiomicrorhabdus aquaedulcis TaxID=2211106 RepID=UPI000FDBD1F1|nr:lytic murein transglycosylase [Thiomicrorhabdus aquaedulcis]
MTISTVNPVLNPAFKRILKLNATRAFFGVFLRNVLALSLTLPLLAHSALAAAQTNPSNAAKQEQLPTQAEFAAWLTGFKVQARQAGISQDTLNLAFADVKLNPKILESDRKQPEFISTFWEYFERAVSSGRIENGQIQLKNHQALLNQVTQKYGVPQTVLLAFWGMETNYGRFTGSQPIIESLATLAFDPRRSGFFTNELLNALLILNRGDVALSQMKGSWAGAMGHVQFMPSNYVKYAVDGDGDGKINLWDSLPDALHSAGNFLQHLGWLQNQHWGTEVTLPQNFNYAQADGKTTRSLAQWHALDLKSVNGQTLSGQPNAQNIQARLVLPSDYRGPAFLVYDNFKIIKRWNNADKYALAVGHLADRIAGQPALSKTKPADDVRLSLDDMRQIQTLLNQQGYPAGEPDGIAGTKTRNALRAFQVANNLPADGYPSAHALVLLKQTQSTKTNATLANPQEPQTAPLNDNQPSETHTPFNNPLDSFSHSY